MACRAYIYDTKIVYHPPPTRNTSPTAATYNITPTGTRTIPIFRWISVVVVVAAAAAVRRRRVCFLPIRAANK